jgi:hypothetical protein
MNDVVCPWGQCPVNCFDVMDVLVRTWSSLATSIVHGKWEGRGATRILRPLTLSLFLGRPGLVRSKPNCCRERPLHFKLLGTRLSHSNLLGMRE